ncbi:probable dolichyl pyrophosphate Man9GlcNAc2 alpha-1,3-glucosyltransferase isoform X2 [Lucilia cuprina]|uniref:probable dolichyl pyrophosphate Man9GlcNAc2 alpha-1,3-glucosyltransferase isoform X2 n=1 Tax=Lucilia cuprina TaxID=7375 RepID=UPI001F063202|nr:probable dolichyl pyrophosphate Man9GlcNAc2 alpha-1,3-glucosyltransferase isoform X2 [Lucilia cuprina]
MRYNCDSIIIFVALCVGIGTRAIVSLSSYSGASTPPMFGDYEAQRHWQEITYNLPPNQWYLNSTDNDLLYWGIDYPPLTAYHSLFVGIIANRINSSYVRLFDSRGLESVEHKSFMRLTVLVADFFIYIPACVIVLTSLNSYISSENLLPTFVLLVLYPGQVLIDNGHFQYNNISLGLFMYSVACIIQNRHNWASFFFTLSINYKQMELYHALPIFVYLLKSSFSQKSFLKNIINLFQVGFITLSTFLLLWMPWICSLNSLTSTVLRLFPLNRGVFEDKVANVWCSLNALYKLKFTRRRFF